MGYTPSFTPQYADGWEDLPVEETPITATALNAYDDAIENIEDYLASDDSQANIADAYDETATYAIGTYVIHNGTLYKCTTAISEAEEWDSTHWTACIVTDEMGSGVSITPTISTGTKIADFEIGGTSGELYVPSGGTIYSTDEQIIGLWIDNRPIYQKSYVVTSSISVTSSWTNTGITLPNEVDRIINGEVYRNTSTGLFSASFNIDTSNHALRIRFASSETLDADSIITIQYTKSS